MNEKKCQNCGAALSEEDIFCPKCGSRAEQEEIIPQTESEAAPFVKQKKNNGKVIAFAICIAVLAVIGAAVVVILLLTSKPKVKSILLEQDNVTINTGSELQLQYTVIPEEASDLPLEWNSTNESVVHVTADGRITAIKQGPAIITVTSENGVSAMCRVTVRQSAYDYLKSLKDYVVDIKEDAYDEISIKTYYGIVYNTSGEYEDTVSLSQMRIIHLNETDTGIYMTRIIIPPECNGVYRGVMEQMFEYYIGSFKSGSDFDALYRFDAETLSSTTKLKSYYCSDLSRQDDIDRIFETAVEEILEIISNEVLLPEGYSLSDLGFAAWK